MRRRRLQERAERRSERTAVLRRGVEAVYGEAAQFLEWEMVGHVAGPIGYHQLVAESTSDTKINNYQKMRNQKTET
jgi:hypothetical protein